MDLLLDVNVTVDSCIGRRPWCDLSDLAMAKCQLEGGRLWLYTGSVQTLEYVVRDELSRMAIVEGKKLSVRQIAYQARTLLSAFAEDKHWLAALAEEGNVFASDDPEDEQLIRALSRFCEGKIRLLTRDARLLERYPGQTFSPETFLRQASAPPPLQFIDLKRQQDAIRPQLERNLHRVLHHGQYILGPEVSELEERLCAYTGAKHCITVASGTEALLISLMAHGIRSGDEVITTPFTFAATAEVVALLGAIPVFVDIEPDTCCIDASKIEPAITLKTKAIVPVSLYGQPADMDEINAIAEKYGLLVIEDAAQSFGAEYKGRKSCTLSTIGCTSFFPSKPLGCYGDGGAIFTGDDLLAKRMREIRVHGQEKRYHHTRIGVGGRMDTLQCAVVLAKLDRFEQETLQRQRIGERYDQLLAGMVPVVARRPDRTTVYAQYTIFVERRDAIINQLRSRGIPAAVHYPLPMNHQPAYAGICRGGFNPVAEQAARRVLSLPMGPDLREAEQDRVVAALEQVLAEVV